MTRLTMAVGAGVLLVLGSACGSSQGTDAQPAPQAPATQAPATQAPAGTPDRQPARTPPDGAKQLPTNQVDYTKLPKGFPKMAWVDGDGKTVGAVAQEGGCGRASAEVSDQGADKVIITLVETQPAKPRPCTMDLRYPKVTAQLETPLGDRTVVLQHAERKA